MDASILHEALIRAIQEKENGQGADSPNRAHFYLEKSNHTPPMTVSNVLDDAGDAILHPHLSR